MRRAPDLKNLRKLTLSKLDLGYEGLISLGKGMIYMDNFEYLDVSYNKLNTKAFTEFFKEVSNQNNLKHLDMSYNVLDTNYSQTDSSNFVTYTFESMFCQFLQLTKTLVHLNISGT